MNLFEDYRVSSNYGPRWGKMHRGIDLVKAHGSPIYAFVAGEVIHASFGRRGTGFGNYGNVVAIKDATGYLHCYCHLDICLVQVGQWIARRQVIGRQGWTGHVVPPGPGGSHLHYEVRSKRKPFFGWLTDVDPLQYLEQFYAEGDDYMLNLEDANKMIRILSAGWFVVQENKEAREEFHRLANELRKASGQPEQ